MKREYFINEFAKRLTALMQQANLSSSRAKSGVKVKKLAQISHCSIQMARNYVHGKALPDVDAIYEIARWLKVSPGWLLYGEEAEEFTSNNPGAETKDLIHIDAELLQYIFSKYAILFEIVKNKQDLADHMMTFIQKITHIQAEKKEAFKFIDMFVNSIIRVHELQN